LHWGKLRYGQNGFPVTDVVTFHDELTASLEDLNAAGIGDFKKLGPGPTLRAVSPQALDGCVVSRAISDKLPAGAQAVLLTCRPPRFVAGLRISKAASTPPSNDWIQLLWRRDGQSDYLVPDRYVFNWGNGKSEQTIFIFATVDQVALHLGNPEAQRSLSADNLPITLLLSDKTDEPARSPASL